MIAHTAPRHNARTRVRWFAQRVANPARAARDAAIRRALAEPAGGVLHLPPGRDGTDVISEGVAGFDGDFDGDGDTGCGADGHGPRAP